MRFDPMGRPLPPNAFYEVQVVSDVMHPAELKPLSIFTPHGAATILHHTVKVGDFVYYPLTDGNGDLHVYARVDDLEDPERVFVTAYSEIVPRGESGSVWIDKFCTVVTPQEFELARRLGWPHPRSVWGQA